MKVHGEGLTDEIKSTNSDSNESELDLDDDDDDDLDNGGVGDSMDDENVDGILNVKKITKTRKRRNRKLITKSLNSDGDDDEIDDDDDEDEYLADGGLNEEDGLLEEKDNNNEDDDNIKADIKREYSPEQTGDGKRPYRRNLAKLTKTKLRKLNSSPSVANLDVSRSTNKRADKKSKNIQSDAQSITAPSVDIAPINQLSTHLETTPNTAAYYTTLGGYAARNHQQQQQHLQQYNATNQHHPNQVNGATYTSSSAQQCGRSADQYNRHYAASQSNQESNLLSNRLIGMTHHSGNEHSNAHHQRLSSPTNRTNGQSHGTSPTSTTLSEW